MDPNLSTIFACYLLKKKRFDETVKKVFAQEF